MIERKTIQVGGTLRQAGAEIVAAWNKAAAGEAVEPSDKTTFVTWSALAAVMTDRRHALIAHLHENPASCIRALLARLHCGSLRNALHCWTLSGGSHMASTAERMKAMRARRRQDGLREIRLIVPDARAEAIRNRIAVQVETLSPASEHEALSWIEEVSEFDEAR